MGEVMVCGPTARPFNSTSPMAALRTLAVGVSRIRRLRCSRRNPRMKMATPMQKPTAAARTVLASSSDESSHSAAWAQGISADSFLCALCVEVFLSPQRTRSSHQGHEVRGIIFRNVRLKVEEKDYRTGTRMAARISSTIRALAPHSINTRPTSMASIAIGSSAGPGAVCLSSITVPEHRLKPPSLKSNDEADLFDP